MSDTGNNPEWWIDGVSVGSNPEAPAERGPDPEHGAATEETEHQPTPPRGVPAVGASAPGPWVGGAAPRGPETPGATTAAWAATPPPGGATGTLDPGTTPPPRPAARQKRPRWPIVVVSILVLIGIILLVNFVVLAGAPAYKVVYGTLPSSVSASEVAVGFTVTNTGSATGKPTCTVRVTSVTGTGTGQGTFTEKQLDPGKGAIFVAWVKVKRAMTHPNTVNTWTIHDITCA